jgi:hypothetical protein
MFDVCRKLRALRLPGANLARRPPKEVVDIAIPAMRGEIDAAIAHEHAFGG